MKQLESPNTTVNHKIQPRTEKEAYVWKACSALYFEDELPVKTITHRRIMTKRAVLEEGVSHKTKGDNSGLSEMKARWAAHHGIDINNDPHQTMVNPIGVGEDPLLRASKLVREQLLEELEQQYQGVIDAAEQKALSLEADLNQLKDKHAELNIAYTEVNTELADLKPQHTQALEQIIILQATVDTLTQTNQALQSAIEHLNQDMEATWQQRLDTELDKKDQDIEKRNKEAAYLKSEIIKTRDSLMELSENQRHQAIVEIEQLKDKNAALQSALDNKLDIDVQLAKTDEINKQLTTQLSELQIQYDEQQTVMASVQEQLHQQASQLQSAKQQIDIESLLKSQFGAQAERIEHLTKSLLADKKDKTSNKTSKTVDVAVDSITESES